MQESNALLNRQNEDANIKKLGAQKQLYSDAKRIFAIQLFLTVLVTILLSILKIILNATLEINFAPYTAVYGILLTILDLVLITPLSQAKKTEAAKVQEWFDCCVYDMGWNKISVGKMPEKETVNCFYKKFLKSKPDLSKFMDWYPIEIKSLPINDAIAQCQKTNLFYNKNLVIEFRKYIVGVCIAVTTLIIISSLAKNISLRSFIVDVMLSAAPVFYLFIKTILEYSKSLKANDELKGTLDNLGRLIDDLSLRAAQDRIFASRKDSVLIPDWFYSFKRNKNEELMHDNAAS